MPDIIIASSDSDMQQLLDDTTYWLELQQVGLGAVCLRHLLD
jgi:5'-3' exonuclease